MNMRISKRLIGACTAIICCLLLSIGIVYADTDGTEMQVEQPSQLEIQLGPEWSGVEFELRTDAGVYPGVITVDETGVLSMEIGGSSSYILSCMSSTVAVPSPEENQAPAANESGTELTETETGSNTDTPLESDRDATRQETKVGGIPIKHLVLFGVGLCCTIGALVALRVVKSRGHSYEDDNDDEFSD